MAPETDRQWSCISQNVGVSPLHSQLSVTSPSLTVPVDQLTTFASNLQIFFSGLIIVRPSFMLYPRRELKTSGKTSFSDFSGLDLTTSCHSFRAYHKWYSPLLKSDMVNYGNFYHNFYHHVPISV